MRWSPLTAFAALITVAASAPAQNGPQEIDELRRRVVAIRAELAQVTAVADYAADIFTRDTTARFLVSTIRNPGLLGEFEWHTGGSPQLRDADDSTARGIVLLPVLSWETGAFGVAALIERYQAAGRPVIVLGSRTGQPDFFRIQHLVPNGAADGGRAAAQINEVANLIAVWTLYMEFVASATRHGWQPGIFVSNLFPNADNINYAVRFHAATRTPVVPIPPGQLGGTYLDRVDSLLRLAALPAHQALMQRAADSLRGVRSAGHQLFVGACAHYLGAGLAGDSTGSPFRPVVGRYEIAGPALARGARVGDAVLWFGYDGYDCPHVEAAGPLQDAKLKVVVVSDDLPAKFPGNVMVAVPLGWHLPEHIGTAPFNAEGVGSASSIDVLVHYLWLRRLVGAAGTSGGS